MKEQGLNEEVAREPFLWVFPHRRIPGVIFWLSTAIFFRSIVKGDDASPLSVSDRNRKHLGMGPEAI